MKVKGVFPPPALLFSDEKAHESDTEVSDRLQRVYGDFETS